MAKDLVVGALRALDYWKVMEYWRLFDKNGNNSMDRVEFITLLQGMNLGSNSLNKAMCAELFDLVDMDGSGEIDLEEFLGWIFSLHSAYCGGIRMRLGQMDPLHVAEHFRRVDTNGNGAVDRAEFATFIKKFSPESNLSRTEINELFSVIDIDRSGEIDATEFINWVYPRHDNCPREESSRRGGRSRAGSPRSRASSRAGRSGANTAFGTGKLNALQHSKPLANLPGTVINAAGLLQPGMQPVCMEFTIGSDFRPIMMEIRKAFKDSFGDAITTKLVEEPILKGCRRLIVMVGRGIVLWDRASMIMHRDDPFSSFETARDFVIGSMKKHLPTLIRAVHLAKRRE